MIQTLVLANSVHHPHSQISTRILSLSLFHTFFEKRACSLQHTLLFPHTVMSPSGWSWYWCLVAKIIVSLKNSFTTVCSWKKRTFVACRHSSEMWYHCLGIHSKLSQFLQLPTLQLNLLLSNAIHFTMNLQLWHLKRASHPVKCFWCDCEKGYIYPLGEI